MRNRASYLLLLGALPLMACDSDPCEGLICVDANDGSDAGTPDAPPPPDVPRVDGGPPPTCGDNGQVGGHCRSPDNLCTAGYPCEDDRGMLVVRTIFNLPQGEPDPENPGYFREVTTPVPANDIPVNIATGGFCTAQCNGTVGPPTMEGAPDLDCTDCSSCSATVGVLGLFGVTSLFADLAYGDNTGWCRADCVFDPATNGGCPSGYTCSAGENVCVEACTSDNQCQYGLEVTRQGLPVTTLDPSRGTCSDVTGRCEWSTPEERHVGDECESSSECTEDVGLCLNGGTCAELQCNRATDTLNDNTFACDLEGSTRNGVCLGFGGNYGAICIQGCNSANDCNPGNACLPFDEPIGAFSGYCLGICDVIADDPDGSGPLTAADDENWPCRSTEVCDQPVASAEEPDPNGSCRPTCTLPADCDEARGEECEMVEGASYGFCRVPDQVCSFEGGDSDCSLEQVCDLVAYDGDFGLCVDRCVDGTDCDAGDECQVDRGVCRTPCDGATACMPADALNCVANLCEQRNT